METPDTAPGWGWASDPKTETITIYVTMKASVIEKLDVKHKNGHIHCDLFYARAIDGGPPEPRIEGKDWHRTIEGARARNRELVEAEVDKVRARLAVLEGMLENGAPIVEPK